MLSLKKEILAELTSDDLASVVGGAEIAATGTTCFIHVEYPESCFAASCITN
jgi:hypothetical protein